jgi:hypothetical protein
MVMDLRVVLSSHSPLGNCLGCGLIPLIVTFCMGRAKRSGGNQGSVRMLFF